MIMMIMTLCVAPTRTSRDSIVRWTGLSVLAESYHGMRPLDLIVDADPVLGIQDMEFKYRVSVGDKLLSVYCVAVVVMMMVMVMMIMVMVATAMVMMMMVMVMIVIMMTTTTMMMMKCQNLQ